MKTQKQDKAMGWANDASGLAADIAKAAKANDMAGAKAGADKLKASCKACHDVHREQLPDKTSKFKAP
jgi:cytochrome c556